MKLRSQTVWLGFVFVFAALLPHRHQLNAQQTQTIKPCVVEKPCTTKPSSTIKSKPVPTKTSVPRRKPPRKRTTSKSSSAKLPTTSESRASETLVDTSIPADPAVEKMLEPYSGKVRALEVVIGKLEGELSKSSIGAGSLGNFVADGIRAYSSRRPGKPVLLAVTNAGGLRKNTIAAGDLRAADIFELLPFENALMEIDLTGEQLRNLLSVVTGGRDAQSGARIKYRINEENKPQMVSAALIDQGGRETPIDRQATYTIVTIDYLYKLGSGSYSILQEGKNVKPLGVSVRDAIMEYVKGETAAGRSIKPTLDGRFMLIDPEQSKPEPKSE